MKLTKTAVGNGSILYRDIANLSREVKLSSTVTPVRNGNVITNIIKHTIDLRMIVASNTACGTDCPPKFPAVIKVSISAPEGVVLTDLLKMEDFFVDRSVSGSGTLLPFVTDEPSIVIE